MPSEKIVELGHSRLAERQNWEPGNSTLACSKDAGADAKVLYQTVVFV